MLPLTEEELMLHQDSTVCYICRKNCQKILQKIKVIINCYFTGRYKGADHSI